MGGYIWCVPVAQHLSVYESSPLNKTYPLYSLALMLTNSLPALYKPFSCHPQPALLRYPPRAIDAIRSLNTKWWPPMDFHLRGFMLTETDFREICHWSQTEFSRRFFVKLKSLGEANQIMSFENCRNWIQGMKEKGVLPFGKSCKRSRNAVACHKPFCHITDCCLISVPLRRCEKYNIKSDNTQ